MDATQIINLLCDKLGIAADWAGENALPVIQTMAEELVAGSIKELTLCMWVGVAVIIVGLGVLLWASQDVYRDPVIGWALVVIGCATLIMCGVFRIEWQTMPTYKAVEYIAKLIKYEVG